MSKVPVADFDTDVCMGEHPDVDGPCPHRVKKDDNTGNRVVDGLAKIEGRAVEAVTGEEAYRCGCCGCPLVNLSLTNRAPSQCPRLAPHNGQSTQE